MKKPLFLKRLSTRIRAMRDGLRGRPWWHYALLVLLGFGTLVLAGLLVVVITIIVFLKDLPSPEDLANFTVAQSTRILDAKGNLLYELHGSERRTVVRLDQMSRLPDAVVAAEDDNFYEHPGFDINGLIRAGFVYAKRQITGSGRIEGGSTITQQFVKNTYLSSERTFSRKAKELFLAMEVEQRFTKQQILEHYLNTVGFGSNAYGAESAARMYFAKSAKDLTLDESAMLIALLQAPSRLSPYGQRSELLTARTKYVLTRMRDTGRITQQEFDAAAAADTLAKVKPSQELIKAPHFVFYIRDQIEETYGKELAERGGLTVTTTLDPEIQEIAETKVADLVRRNGKNAKVSNAALVSVDPRTGAIVAMVGSKDYFAEDVDGKVNVTTSKRQPGSSWKPFVYANFFRKGFGPGSVLWDTETDFGNNYRPNNFSGKFSGPTTVRKAVGGSLNIPAIKALYVAGLDDTIDLTANAFGFASVKSTPRNAIGLSFAIGAVEVTPLEMAQGYSVFAANGTFRPAIGIQKVVDAKGNVLEEISASQQGSQVIDPQVAFLVNNTLSDCSSRPAGWGSLCYAPRYNVAAKTGTSNKRVGTTSYPADFWTMTYTPTIVTAMWAGNNDGSVLNVRADSLGTVAPIMKEYLLEVLDRKGVVKEEFARPDGITEITLSNLTGLPTSGGGVHRDLISNFGKEYLQRFRSEPPLTAEVDESCGPALASAYSPPKSIKTYIYSNLHDLLFYVRPNDPLLAAFERTARGYSGTAIGDGSNVVYVDSPSKIPTEVCAKYGPESAPQISLVSPASGLLQTGPNTVAVQLTSFTPIAKVEFSFDGTVFANTSACTRCEATLSVAEGTTGDHVLTVLVEDELGFANTASFPITVSAAADTTPPDVSITEPGSGQTYTPGSIVSVEVRASDQSGIAAVELAYNRIVFATITEAPFRGSFTIPMTDSGQQEISVTARDGSGNIGNDASSIVVQPSE